MPELPEVETIARSLMYGGFTGESVLNRQIVSAELFWKRTLAGCDAEDGFEPWFAGKTITNVTRRGKYILIQIPPKTLMIHLRMSGDLRVTNAADDTLGKHDHFVLHFTDGGRLVFNDTRKFGRLWLLDDPESVLRKLGIEPLSEAFNAKWLYGKLQQSQRAVKAFLLNQELIAGIGNIYCDESLFQAKIHPRRAANSLTFAEAQALVQAIQNVLMLGIQTNGASIDWVYRGGHFQNHFQVYQRTGQPCPVCGTIIEKTVVGQRGTHFCPNCQPFA